MMPSCVLGDVAAMQATADFSLPRGTLRGRPDEADGAEQREGDELPHRRDHPRRAPPLAVLLRRLEVDLHAHSHDQAVW